MTAPTPPSISWAALYPTLNTGDILSFAGDGAMDYAIQFVEGAPYTHVGMVIKSGASMWFWDAPGGGNTFPDPISKNPNQTGARVADLQTIVSYYMSSSGGEVDMWVRQLSPVLTTQQQANLMTFVGLADGTPFPGNDLKFPAPWNLGAGFAASWLAGVKYHATIAGTFFCAQLAAQSYMAMGLLPIWPNPANAYDPASFNSSEASVFPIIGNTLSASQVVTFP